MSNPLRNEYFGPYKIIRSLGSAHGASRFVVLCNRTDTNYLLYRFEKNNNLKARRMLFDALVKMSTLDHPHLLQIHSVSYDDHGNLCVITPYTGNHEGLVTLDDLLDIRDGKISVPEAVRAIQYLLDAIASAHQTKIFNGSIDPQDILVNRHGSLQIQFYGFNTLTRPAPNPIAQSILIADEIRSIADLGYTMMTGLSTRGDRIAPSRVIKKMDKNWDTWFELGLDPIDGFESIKHAINALPSNPDCTEWLTTKSTRLPQVHIGSMLRRFRSTTASPTKPQRDRD
jgi:serine/threonine protein kinase